MLTKKTELFGGRLVLEMQAVTPMSRRRVKRFLDEAGPWDGDPDWRTDYDNVRFLLAHTVDVQAPELGSGADSPVLTEFAQAVRAVQADPASYKGRFLWFMEHMLDSIYQGWIAAHNSVEEGLVGVEDKRADQLTAEERADPKSAR
jgi:hypothetical protein